MTGTLVAFQSGSEDRNKSHGITEAPTVPRAKWQLMPARVIPILRPDYRDNDEGDEADDSQFDDRQHATFAKPPT